MTGVRGKSFVLGLQKMSKGPGTTIKLGAVSASDKERSENNIYHKHTPSGSIEMYVDNPHAEEFFTIGRVVYVDFSEAPAE